MKQHSFASRIYFSQENFFVAFIHGGYSNKDEKMSWNQFYISRHKSCSEHQQKYCNVITKKNKKRFTFFKNIFEGILSRNHVFDRTLAREPFEKRQRVAKLRRVRDQRSFFGEQPQVVGDVMPQLLVRAAADLPGIMMIRTGKRYTFHAVCLSDCASCKPSHRSTAENISFI